VKNIIAYLLEHLDSLHTTQPSFAPLQSWSAMQVAPQMAVTRRSEVCERVTRIVRIVYNWNTLISNTYGWYTDSHRKLCNHPSHLNNQNQLNKKIHI